jgi:hypothetical protein
MARNPVDELCTDLRNAYEAHDHDAFSAHLARLRRLWAYTGPVAPGAPSGVVVAGAPAAPQIPLLKDPEG